LPCSEKQQQKEQQLYKQNLVRLNQKYDNLYEVEEADTPAENYRPRTSRYQRVTDVLQIDQRILNFGYFMPGNCIGISFNIANKTKYTQIIEVRIDEQSYMYSKEAITREFPDVLRPQTKGPKFDLSTVFADKQKILNSEIKHQCWYIDNPKHREFLKVMTMKMGPNAV
jgi:hypothetical protein